MTPARLSRLLAASIPLLVAVLIAKLWLTGTIGYYINDRTTWIVVLGGLLFAAVGGANVIRAFRSPDDAPPLSWKGTAFLIPVILGLVVPAQPLSSTSAQSSSLGALQLASHVSTGGTGDSFGYWVSSVGSHTDAAWWSGQRVTLVGFSSRQDGLKGNTFIVARYLVTCCVVDATLFGFPVELDHGPLPADGTWVQVNGRFGTRFWTDRNGSQWPIIQRARIVPVSIPSSPYLSP